jgi:hypothetical protein
MVKAERTSLGEKFRGNGTALGSSGLLILGLGGWGGTFILSVQIFT